MRILIVEDEQKMAKLLKKGLEEEGHSVMLAHDGVEGFEMSQTYSFDVMILDIMLPGLTGFEVVRRLRAAKNHVPVLMLTALDAVSDIVKGLHLGGDDYLTKPFAFHELLARLEAISRRGPVERLPKLQIADLVLDSVTRTVTRAEKQIHLTKTEYLLLEFMIGIPAGPCPETRSLRPSGGSTVKLKTTHLMRFFGSFAKKWIAGMR